MAAAPTGGGARCLRPPDFGILSKAIERSSLLPPVSDAAGSCRFHPKIRSRLQGIQGVVNMYRCKYPEMPQYVPRNISLHCYDYSNTGPHNGLPNFFNPGTSNPMNANLSSITQIGQRLAAIGDELYRPYRNEVEIKKVHAIRQSIRNCQKLALSLMRSVKNIVSRVDHGATGIPDRRTPVSPRDPVTVHPNLLLLAALGAICGLVIKLGLDD